MSDDWIDLSHTTNLRVDLQAWPAGYPLPKTLHELAKAALDLTVPRLLAGLGAPIHLVRFATDGVSVWLADAPPPSGLEDFARAAACAFEPAAFAVGIVQPMTADGDATPRGVHCKLAFGDELIELQGPIEGADGPAEQRRVPGWQVRTGRVTDPKARWIGALPSVPLRLGPLGAAEA